MIHLNLETLESKSRLFKYLKEKLELPENCGENLDALYDVLTESAKERRIIIEGYQKYNDMTGGYGERLLRMFRDAERVTDGLHVELLEEGDREGKSGGDRQEGQFAAAGTGRQKGQSATAGTGRQKGQSVTAGSDLQDGLAVEGTDELPAAEEQADQPAPWMPEDQAVSFHRPHIFALTSIHEAPPEQGVFYREDGRPFVRLCIQNACSVELEIDGKRQIFLEVAKNVWELTLDLAPGFYYVSLLLDGVEALSPFLPVGFGYSRPSNFLEIGPGEGFYENQQVPNGSLHHEYFQSSVTGAKENCLVYTPYGYEQSQEEYPVLYLQHGFGENETGWVWQGRLLQIADNLIAAKKAVPMLIVMSDGMVRRMQNGQPKLIFEQFPEYLLQDIMPAVEGKYRVKKDRRSRAMAGLSMGSIQTSMTVFENLDKFGWAGLFSGFMRNFIGTTKLEEGHLRELLADTQRFNEELFLFYRAIGEQDSLYHFFAKDDEICEKYEIRQTRRIFQGGHDWNVWRKCLYEFMQLIFVEN